MRVEDVLDRLHGVTGGNGQWYAQCPAHEDRSASLAIALGRDERTLLTCWAGCELVDIVHAIGLDVTDLFASNGDEPRERVPWGNRSMGATLRLVPSDDDVRRWRDQLQADVKTCEAVRGLKGWTRDSMQRLAIGMRGDRLTIPVRELDDTIVSVLRYWPEATPKMLASKGHRRVPYYALRDEFHPVWIVEGETDAIGMATMGFNVIGAPGASSAPKPEWLAIVNMRDVVVCMDCDEPGRRAAVRWASACREAGALRVLVLDLAGPSGYDVGDLLVEAGDPDTARAQLLARADEAHDFVPKTGNGAPTMRVELDDRKTGELIQRSLGDVTPEPLDMLWRDRIPRGRVGILFGPPGQGKSTLLAMLSAEVTKTGGRVLLASAEDDPATTIVTRMIAADADLAHVDLLSTQATKGETSLVLPRDLDRVAEAMKDATLLIIDPLMAHLGDDVNTWSDQSIRAKVLAPLAWHARVNDCAVVLLLHMNKSDNGDPLARITGSGGFGAAARFVLLLGYHPADVWLDEGVRRLVLVHVKASESRKQLAMVFRRELVGVDIGSDRVSSAPVLDVIETQASISAEAVLEHTTSEDQSTLGEAVAFLRHELADGPKLAKNLLRMSRERGDFSERTLRRAKRGLGAVSIKDMQGWWWCRPEDADTR